MAEYSTELMAEMIGCTKQTVLNWIHNDWLKPYRKDEYGHSFFSQEQYDLIKASLPLPKYSKRKQWLSQFSRDTICEELKELPPPDKSLLPSGKSITNPGIHTLYDVPNRTESAQKIANILEKSNLLLFESLGHKVNIHNLDELARSTCDYFTFCQAYGVMPSMRRLANWFGYSLSQLKRHIQQQTPTGQYLDQIRDAIKDNLEQAALVNAVNNISAMFILKSQYDYVEATKVILEPSESILGQPKTPEEIANCIDADIVED